MPRTTPQAVKGVLQRDYDTINNPSLTPYIDTAAVIVSRVATCATTKGVTLSSAELELIERWLAAHFYAVSDKPYTNNTTADASAAYNGQTAMGLDATLYGQQAKAIDYSGCLAAITSRVRASAAWLGKPPSSQIDYIDRD